MPQQLRLSHLHQVGRHVESDLRADVRVEFGEELAILEAGVDEASTDGAGDGEA